MKETIIIGSDHGGFELKEYIKKLLNDESIHIVDAGCFDTQSVHYPQIAQTVAEQVSNGTYSRGILVCGTGIGMSIVANRFKNVRATLCHDHLTAVMSRQHNNSNILVLGGRVLGLETTKEILHTWLTTEFEGGRHAERLRMIDRPF